jgi:hypothetical protein
MTDTRVRPDLANLDAMDGEVRWLNLIYAEPASLLLKVLHNFVGLTEEAQNATRSWACT